VVEGELPGSERTAARTEKTRFRVDWETKEPSGRQKGQRNADRPATIAVGGCRCWATSFAALVDSQLKQAFKI
jgi:hypothetical protein